MLPAFDVDASLLAALHEEKPALVKPQTRQSQVEAAKSALLSNIRIARLEKLNEAMRLDNELAHETFLETLERIYDMEKRYGVRDEG